MIIGERVNWFGMKNLLNKYNEINSTRDVFVEFAMREYHLLDTEAVLIWNAFDIIYDIKKVEEYAHE